MEVKLIGRTDEIGNVLYNAYKQCYSKDSVDLENVSSMDKVEYITRMLATGHDSPLEHIYFNFEVEGVSRILTHQLIRKRVASYTQQSGRYVSAENMNYVIPPKIADNQEALAIYQNTMKMCWKAYADIDKLLKLQGYDKTEEDARFVIPQAMSSRLAISMNLRSLINFFQERTCKRSQWEIRELATKMLTLVHQEIPYYIPKVSYWCDTKKICKEHGKMACGRHPTERQLLEAYKIKTKTEVEVNLRSAENRCKKCNRISSPTSLITFDGMCENCASALEVEYENI